MTEFSSHFKRPQRTQSRIACFRLDEVQTHIHRLLSRSAAHKLPELKAGLFCQAVLDPSPMPLPACSLNTCELLASAMQWT